MSQGPKKYTAWEKYFIRALRKLSINDPVRKEVFNKARTGDNKYLCASCKDSFPRYKCNDDHIDPVICPETGWIDQLTFFSRLFCSAENRQLLCRDCHKTKTLAENELRKKRYAEPILSEEANKLLQEGIAAIKAGEVEPLDMSMLADVEIDEK